MGCFSWQFKSEAYRRILNNMSLQSIPSKDRCSIILLHSFIVAAKKYSDALYLWSICSEMHHFINKSSFDHETGLLLAAPHSISEKMMNINDLHVVLLQLWQANHLAKKEPMPCFNYRQICPETSSGCRKVNCQALPRQVKQDPPYTIFLLIFTLLFISTTYKKI